MKTCRTCGLIRPLDEYNQRQNACRICTKKAFLVWRAKPENSVRILVNNARGRARRAGLEFNITHNDLPLPTHCPVLGIPFDPGGEQTPNSPSIDRLNPAKGYTPENTVIISVLANRIKSDASPPQIRKVADWLEAIIQFRNNPALLKDLVVANESGE